MRITTSLNTRELRDLVEREVNGRYSDSVKVRNGHVVTDKIPSGAVGEQIIDAIHKEERRHNPY